MAVSKNKVNVPASNEEDINFTDEFIGSRLMDAITSGLYDGNLNCIREYVQNGIDSDGTKNIVIRFENGGENLEIKDDGKGMNRELLKYALRIGFSEKGNDKVGWRGIGIWSGVSICRRIKIITKMENGEKLAVEIDNEVINEGKNKNESILTTLNKAVSRIKHVPTSAREATEHYTIIRLESILPQHRAIFNEKDITEYLMKTVPAPFDEQNFKFAKEINDLLKSYGVEQQNVNITFNDKVIYRPPTRDDIFWDAVIKEPFIVDGKVVAIGWFLTHNKNEILDPPNNGIYFKKKGFTIGDETSVTKQYTDTYARWQFGEIHILSDDLRENTARNNFERSPVVEKFLEQLRDFFHDLQLQNKYQSPKNQTQNIARAQSLAKNGKVNDAEKVLNKVNERLSSKISFPQRPSLQAVKEKIDSTSTTNKAEVKRVKATLKQTTQTVKKETEDKFAEAILSGLSPKVKEKVTKRVKAGGLKDPVIQITDVIEEALKDKSGLAYNEIAKLSREIYGWDSITLYRGTYSPILVLDPMKDAPKDNTHRNRNLRFGAMVYTTHDLFVNLFKHEKGSPALEWFEGASPEEQKKMAIEMIAVIDLIYRMIERSKKYQP